jgi:hypothetical protein
MIKKAASAHARLMASDLLHAVKHERTVQIMLVILIVSLVCWQMPYANIFLYPFKLFVTTIHEACHALVARLTGGNVQMISIAPDESGLTLTAGGIRPLISMAGYLGTAVFGGMLIWWGKRPADARFILQSIGTVILALTVFYGGGGIFSFVSMLVIGAAILWVSRKASDTACHMFLLMLAVQTTLNSVLDIQTLFLVSVMGGQHSDAKNMEGMTGIPAIVWSLLWGLIALAILTYSLWASYRPQSKTPKTESGSPVIAGLSSQAPPEDPLLLEQELEGSLADLKLQTGSATPQGEKIKIKVKPKEEKKKK